MSRDYIDAQQFCRSDVSVHNSAARKIALAHDWLVGLRGGEWVLDRLARLFGPTEIYTLVDDHRFLTDPISRCTVITSPLQRFPGASGRLRRHYLPLMPWAVERLKVGRCDLLISTSSAVMKSIRPPAGVPHICYCHSPARYIWEQTDDYAHGSGGGLRTLGLKVIRRRFQEWDRRTAERVTHFLANSEHTAARIKRCYGRDAQVVYPPVRTEFFTVNPDRAREDWLLVVGALEPYKRTDIVIQAARQLNIRLKIAGNGSQRRQLEQLAGNGSVEFLGRVSDDTLRELYRSAGALVFAQVEDFGIIAAEAQACGCPVIAFDGGGAKEIVRPDTGASFSKQTSESLIGAIQQMSTRTIAPHVCRANALRFAVEEFDRKMLEVVNRTLASRL